ncbi:MAG: 23S rRNA (uracil(1939)-C(5))-methyltransferase RlmD [Lachnospiraceae bacterium]|nr:23S rRNA (uracil(1939)-C(5))-methyltransferase RlmD [Lachnospiraceae bacterium]
MNDKLIECVYSKKCGGCDYCGIPYDEQLQKKHKELVRLLGKFGKVDHIIPADNVYHYRNKVVGTFGFTRKNEYISGVYEKNSHRIVKIDDCLITDKTANAIILSIRNLLRSFKIRTYNEDTGYGLLRHVLVRVGRNSGSILVVLVCASPIFPSKNNFVKALRKLYPQIESIVLNINDRKTSMILGERNINLYGPGYIEDTLCGLKFRISPQSFYQVNHEQTEKLYGLVADYAGLAGKERVLDAYSGIGTIGMTLASGAKEVISVELNEKAHRDACRNAEINNIHNVRFFCEDATKFIETVDDIDVIIMDPPRSGSTTRFIDAVAKLQPDKVIYVSCGPDSLARDLAYFKKKGYAVRKITPVDMFCFTKHVETVVSLSRKC